MSFLKKFGQRLLQVVGIVSGVFPVIQAAGSSVSGGNATVQDTFTKIGAAVMTVESVGAALTIPLSGPEKLKGIVPIVAQIVQTSELMAGKKVKDEAAFTKALQTITGGVADLLNAVE